MKSGAIRYGRDETRRRLEETGFEPAQAELLVRLVSDRAETSGSEMNALMDDMAGPKGDVRVLRNDMAGLKSQVAGLEVRMAGVAAPLTVAVVRMAFT